MTIIMYDGIAQQAQPYIAHGTLAVFGAIVHAAKAHREKKTMFRTKWQAVVDFFWLTVMSSFSGAMFLLIGLHMWGPDSYLTGAMAGTGGFVGVEGMTFVITYITKRYK